jgi:nucleotide-binding universal stress UspA family protein
MMTPQSVLVAVDFGEASARAVTIGGAIAERCGVPLRLLHAESIEAPPYFTLDQVEALERQRQASRAQAEHFLTRFGAAHTNHAFSPVIADGPPATAILHHAREGDLIVMGTHGRHGPKRWWLGSVAECVLRETRQALLVVHSDLIDVSQFVQDVGRCFHDALTSGPQTFIAIAAPVPRPSSWLSHLGEPLLRSSRLPVLFVPEISQGAPK